MSSSESSNCGHKSHYDELGHHNGHHHGKHHHHDHYPSPHHSFFPGFADEFFHHSPFGHHHGTIKDPFDEWMPVLRNLERGDDHIIHRKWLLVDVIVDVVFVVSIQLCLWRFCCSRLVFLLCFSPTSTT